jgi:hypothetical protein
MHWGKVGSVSQQDHSGGILVPAFPAEPIEDYKRNTALFRGLGRFARRSQRSQEKMDEMS